MRFSTVFSALAIVVSGATAANTYTSAYISSATALNAKNHYGAPIPPWEAGHRPGWYYGRGNLPTGISHNLDGLLCELLQLLHLGFYCPYAAPPPPHNAPPPPPPEYSQTFYNLACAAQDGSYQTYGLVDTVADCQVMCDSVAGCTFVNSYHDNNSAAKNSTQLTCSLFTTCLTAAAADNCAGQPQPDGSLDYITNSDGYCKKTPTPYV
ncbi:hypothetical protein C8R44DRAFT_720537 [Mycena epipterygia]|nr:hypothetical protein C8R44DRAFT_720537 [Mycena epipterygia]